MKGEAAMKGEGRRVEFKGGGAEGWSNEIILKYFKIYYSYFIRQVQTLGWAFLEVC